ncbi:helix-turn-helix domain-containing protein [Stappia sp. ICDLI1TA098]
MTPNSIIASAIRRERELAQVSLSALAARAGLSKSTLSQLEAGKGNPNVETLWAIATALDIPFSSLFENASSHSALVRATEGVSLSSQTSDFAAVLLDKCPPDRRRDLYRISLKPGSARQSEPHPRGTVEHAFLCSGRVRLGPVDAPVEIGPGDYFRCFGDVAHFYEAFGEEALLLLVMDSPR